MEPILRSDGQSKVVLCNCGKLHFTYGSVTLHFDRDEFLLFAESVGRLNTMVKQAATGSSFAPDRILNTTLCHEGPMTLDHLPRTRPTACLNMEQSESLRPVR